VHDPTNSLWTESGSKWRMKANYAFKPTAEPALGFDRGVPSRGGLMRR